MTPTSVRAELFNRRGYAATTDDIATAAVTTRATFYAYFPSRSELMRALIDEKLNEGLQRIRSAHRGSTADDLVAAVRDGRREAIHSWLTEKADRWRSIHSIIRIGHDAAAVDPELRDLVKLWLAEATGDTEEGLGQADRFQRTNAASGASSPCHSSTPGHSTGVRRTGSSAASRCSTS